ncbi:hypothetical protein GOL30_30380, partial [Sinorhizobium medicae]|nr:hypothetical protein [Sinorhizobium medicae]MDX0913392.1 hypothetical protein [Sinorhizobium medicae]MDX1078910.1 hypothetical protein [Sinorhizobium medicae]
SSFDGPSINLRSPQLKNRWGVDAAYRALIRQSRSEASERRTQMAAIQRDHERLALEVEKLKLEFSEEHGKGKSLRIAK